MIMDKRDVVIDALKDYWHAFENAGRVAHGRWETDGIMMDDGEYLVTRCTACGEAYEYGYNMPFCPHCGAKMDGDHYE